MFYTKDSKELVYDLIAAANPNIQPPLTSANSVIEAITSITPGAANGNHNTQARVRALQGNGYSGSFFVTYNRIAINQIIRPNDTYNNQARTRIDSYSVATLHNALPLINLRYGVNLNTWDVQNYGISGANIADNVTAIGLSAVATSPAYIGSATIIVYRGKPTLEEQASNTMLSQYQHFDGTADSIAAGMKSAALATWGLDLSDNKTMINTANAVIGNWDALMGILAAQGIPAMDKPTSNQIGVVRASGNQYANPNFDYVTIITGLTGTGIQGTAYLHFNN